MLISLELTNFQRHEYLKIDLTAGLQAIRGANEDGKSTLYRAVNYAWFGSRALPLSLEETVTWTKPVSSLKVVLTFSVGKSTYTITRRKAGAELVGEGVTASGHAEVTAFVERLLGAPAKLVQATLLAHQGSLKDGLDSSATPLIEKLANLDLFDFLIGKIQTELPCGNTKALEAQVQAAMSYAKPVFDSKVFEDDVVNLAAQVVNVKKNYDEVSAQLIVLSDAAQVVTAKMQANNSLLAQVQSLSKALDRAKAAAVHPGPRPTADLERLQKASEDTQHNVRVTSAMAAMPKPAETYMDREQWKAEKQSVEQSLAGKATELRDAELSIASASARKITQTACGLCGKDLAEVPEVVQANEKLDSQIAAAQATVASLATDITRLKIRLKELNALKDADQEPTRLAGVMDLVEVNDSVIPRRYSVKAELRVIDFDPAVDKTYPEAVAEQRAYGKKLDAYEAARKTVADLEADIIALQLKEQPVSDEDRQTLLSHHTITGVMQTQTTILRQVKDQHTAAVAALESAKAVFAVQLKAYEAAVAERDKLQATLTEFYANNALLSKLREVRPVVAKQLWQLVLGSISQYFSTIRGTTSIVSRDNDGFLIDGKRVAAYSGSTQDALGLAIRLTLMKTFLPNADFLMVDEPGAACDDDREAAMIALLPNCGLTQVLLVTHSKLADAYAVNVIQL